MEKVIFFIAAGVGGAERQAVIISKYLSDEKFEVIYHTFGPKNELDAFIPKGRKTIYHKEPKFTHNLLSHMRHIIKAEKPDIVYGAEMPINWRLILASRFTGVKVVLRNDNYLYTQSFSQKLRLVLTYRFADYIISQTDEMTEGLVKGLHIKSSLVHTMANAIDKEYIDRCVKEPSPFPNDGKMRYVAIGRYHREKGFDLLIKAFSRVKKSIPISELYIVGAYTQDNEVYKDVQEIATENGISDDVHCVGFKTNPYVYAANANCFVLSSRNEGLPNVMLEALYLGTPVAAFKCVPVIQRILTDGKDGYLAEKKDVQSLAKAMTNAVKLGRIKSSYHQNSEESFSKVFENL